MSSIADPISTALEVLEKIPRAGDIKKDPERFKVRIPVNPGEWNLRFGFQCKHNFWKWTPRAGITLRRLSRRNSRFGTTATILESESSLSTNTDEERRTTPKEEDIQSLRKLTISVPREVSHSDEDDDELFDFDEEEETEQEKQMKKYSQPQMRYHETCYLLKVHPSKTVHRQIHTCYLSMKGMRINDLSFQAVMTALITNPYVERLDLSETRVNESKMTSLCDLFTEENAITDLILCGNDLSSRSLQLLTTVIEDIDNLTLLDLSNNPLRDSDVERMVRYLSSTAILEFLLLNECNLGEKAGIGIGAALVSNWSLKELYLKCNCICNEGMAALLDGISKNNGLESLDISFNSVHGEPADRLRALLRSSCSVASINLTGCCVEPSDLETITAGLVTNTTLSRIELSNNPLLTSNLEKFLEAILAANDPFIKRINLGQYQVLTIKGIKLANRLFDEKNIDVRCGGFIPYSKDLRKDMAIRQEMREHAFHQVAKLDNARQTSLAHYFAGKDLEEIQDLDIDVSTESFLWKYQQRKLTFLDLALRIIREGDDPKQTIKYVLETYMADDLQARKKELSRKKSDKDSLTIQTATRMSHTSAEKRKILLKYKSRFLDSRLSDTKVDENPQQEIQSQPA